MEHTPSISMRSDARYTTRQSLFDNHILGPLTDSDINRYKKMGRYGKVAPLSPKKKRSSTVSKTKKLLDSLFA